MSAVQTDSTEQSSEKYENLQSKTCLSNFYIILKRHAFESSSWINSCVIFYILNFIYSVVKYEQ